MSYQVIIFLPSFESGGVERNAIILANELVKEGVDVGVLCARIESEQRNKLRKEVRLYIPKNELKIPWVHYRLIDAVSLLFYSVVLLRALKKENKTILVGFQSAVVAIFISKISRVKVVSRISNHFISSEVESSYLRSLSEYMKRVFYRFSDAVVANSLELANDYRNRLGCPIETIYNPIKYLSTPGAELPCDQALSEIYLNPKKRVIVSAGRLTPQKGFDTLISAFSLVHREQDVYLLIIGDGAEKERLVNLSKKLKVEKSIWFLGYQQEVEPFFMNADLFVLSSRYEGMPNVLIEALFCGLPVVSTNCKSGPRELLEEGKLGKLVNVDDVDGLASAMSEMLINPFKPGQILLEELREKFSKKSMLERYKLIFTRLAS